MRFGSILLLGSLLFGRMDRVWPASFHWRGVLEGFYGRPWDWSDRRELIPWLAAHQFNLLVIAPKDGAFHRSRWREPLPRSEESSLGQLCRLGRSRGIAIGWTLSPLGIRYDEPSELERALSKLESVLRAGVRWPAIAFDDTDPDERQIDFANRLLSRLLERRRDLRMVFVPALYWGAEAESPYLRSVARRLDRRFVVAWTGGGILARAITAEDARRFALRMEGRPLALGDNYPVQDRLTESGPLFLGPLTGRDPNLSMSQDAYLANASPLPGLSRLPLATAGRFAADPAGYDAESAWGAAVAELFHDSSLRALARECRSSWLTPVGEEAGRLPPAIERCVAADCGPLQRLLSMLQGSRDALRTIQPSLARELYPWAGKATDFAVAGIQGAQLLELIRSGRRPRAAEVRAWELLRVKVSRESSLIAGVAPERFLNSVETALEGGMPYPPVPIATLARRCSGGDAAAEMELRSSLSRLIQLPEAAKRIVAGTGDPAKHLLPWFDVWADEAGDALRAMDGRTLFLAEPRSLRSWRLRLKFLPLLACRGRLDNFLSETERHWLPPEEIEEVHASRLLAVYLWAMRWVAPRSFPARLERAIDRSDMAELALLAEELEDLAPRFESPGFPEEVIPWLRKIADYGRATRMALRYRERLARGETLSQTEIEGWRRRREDLRSSNGLELALQLRLTLEALRSRGVRMESRGAFDVSYPPNIAEAY